MKTYKNEAAPASSPPSKTRGRLLDRLCLGAALLFPFLSGAALVRVLGMGGAPLWALALHGAVTLGGLLLDAALGIAALRARRERREASPGEGKRP